MFGFFKNKKNECPISEDVRIWMENAIIWLINEFGEGKILSVKTLTPEYSDFPVEALSTEQVAYETLAIVARQMDIDHQTIELVFYNEQLLEIKGNMGFVLHGQQLENEQYSSGQYWGKKGDKFQIAVETSQIKDLSKLVSILAHELAHIKILGEGRLKENDEYLTDLVTVFYGLGIFNANTAFQFYADSDKWGYSKQGYLTQQEWGYALALYAYIRGEKEPDWTKFLTTNIQSDFKKSKAYIYDNPDKVLV